MALLPSAGAGGAPAADRGRRPRLASAHWRGRGPRGDRGGAERAHSPGRAPFRPRRRVLVRAGSPEGHPAEAPRGRDAARDAAHDLRDLRPRAPPARERRRAPVPVGSLCLHPDGRPAPRLPLRPMHVRPLLAIPPTRGPRRHSPLTPPTRSWAPLSLFRGPRCHFSGRPHARFWLGAACRMVGRHPGVASGGRGSGHWAGARDNVEAVLEDEPTQLARE
jgi:hypothetical protein